MPPKRSYRNCRATGHCLRARLTRHQSRKSVIHRHSRRTMRRSIPAITPRPARRNQAPLHNPQVPPLRSVGTVVMGVATSGLLLATNGLLLATGELLLATDELLLATGGLLLATDGLLLATDGLLLATDGLLLATSGLLLATAAAFLPTLGS